MPFLQLFAIKQDVYLIFLFCRSYKGTASFLPRDFEFDMAKFLDIQTNSHFGIATCYI